MTSSTALSLNTGTPGTAGGTWKTTFNNGKRTLYRNDELEYYVDPDYRGGATSRARAAALLSPNGILTISARPASDAALPYLEGHPYTSGLLTTQTASPRPMAISRSAPRCRGPGLVAGLLAVAGGRHLAARARRAGADRQRPTLQLRTASPARRRGRPAVTAPVSPASTSAGFHTYGSAVDAADHHLLRRRPARLARRTPADITSRCICWSTSPSAALGRVARRDHQLVDRRLQDRLRPGLQLRPNVVGAAIVTLSNDMEPADLSSSFTAPSTGPTAPSPTRAADEHRRTSTRHHRQRRLRRE